MSLLCNRPFLNTILYVLSICLCACFNCLCLGLHVSVMLYKVLSCECSCLFVGNVFGIWGFKLLRRRFVSFLIFLLLFESFFPWTMYSIIRSSFEFRTKCFWWKKMAQQLMKSVLYKFKQNVIVKPEPK